MNNKINLLSLDPMYSSLHWLIGHIVATRKYAILSGLSLGLYLPGFNITSAHKLIGRVKKTEMNDAHAKQIVLLTKNYYQCFINKKEKRTLNGEEIAYMSKFYIAVKKYLIEKEINLVILHNDTRWQHALAIQACKELGIKYLVTEQGLIRPNTTVLDLRGCNANSILNGGSGSYIPNSSLYPTQKMAQVKFHHESWLSKGIFSGYLMLNYLERFLGTQLKYRHNNYPLMKYIRRALKNNKEKPFISIPEHNRKKVLLLLQIETDSQILMHSDIENNQHLINEMEKICRLADLDLLIKPHPVDINRYSYGNRTYLVEGAVKKLVERVDAVITVNSSAALQVISTSTPLFLIGESIYARTGVAERITLSALSKRFLNKRFEQETYNRKAFFNYLRHEYLLHGAGFSYNKAEVARKLFKLMEHEKPQLPAGQFALSAVLPNPN